MKTFKSFCTKCQSITEQLDNTAFGVCLTCNTQNSLLNSDGNPHPFEQQIPAPIKVINLPDQYGVTPVMIKCPECETIQAAIIENTLPWETYVHICVGCKHTIMESEWHEIKPFSAANGDTIQHFTQPETKSLK